MARKKFSQKGFAFGRIFETAETMKEARSKALARAEHYCASFSTPEYRKMLDVMYVIWESPIGWEGDIICPDIETPKIKEMEPIGSGMTKENFIAYVEYQAATLLVDMKRYTIPEIAAQISNRNVRYNFLWYQAWQESYRRTDPNLSDKERREEADKNHEDFFNENYASLMG